MARFRIMTHIYIHTHIHTRMLVCNRYFRLHSRGRRRAPLPRPCPSFGPDLMAVDSDLCANFLSVLRAPKAPKTLTCELSRSSRLKNGKISRIIPSDWSICSQVFLHWVVLLISFFYSSFW